MQFAKFTQDGLRHGVHVLKSEMIVCTPAFPHAGLSNVAAASVQCK
jgi:hypothetical protein